MSNIRRLSDLEGNGNPHGYVNPNRGPIQYSLIPMLGISLFLSFSIPFIFISLIVNPMNNTTNPRKENFCEFLKLTCCPTFTIFSFIVLICLFDLIYFLTELAISSRVHGEFLQPDSAALMKLGAKYPFNMKRGYVWLFLTPCFREHHSHSDLRHEFRDNCWCFTRDGDLSLIRNRRKPLQCIDHRWSQCGCIHLHNGTLGRSFSLYNFELGCLKTFGISEMSNVMPD